MSLTLVHSRARAGVDAPLVRVEVHLSGGLPVTQIVGLAKRAANGLELFKVQRKEGLCYPSGTTGKLSCGLADGAAGVAMFLDRLAHDKPNRFFMLDELLEVDP